MSSPIRYLALGDSYTIGTGASGPSHNFPSLLARRLTDATRREVQLTNPAVNGFTTLDLMAKELDRVNGLKPDLVTVLIGVNDLVQNRSVDEYRASLRTIYDRVRALASAPGRVAAISIPNWSVVPAAAQFGEPTLIRTVTNDYNAAARDEALERGFIWIDITYVSTYRLGAPGWIAADQLHPGDIQYEAWAEVIWDRVRDSWMAVAA
ncbi:MAG TPA: SGNH/GDSL hydrolase family protein [Candidatus Dormibacteraeota bacterium]|nr:SGNH/GDSL hydrolase family protein [Candidatus Dormibacteraeota bacterium]